MKKFIAILISIILIMSNIIIYMLPASAFASSVDVYDYEAFILKLNGVTIPDTVSMAKFYSYLNDTASPYAKVAFQSIDYNSGTGKAVINATNYAILKEWVNEVVEQLGGGSDSMLAGTPVTFSETDGFSEEPSIGFIPFNNITYSRDSNTNKITTAKLYYNYGYQNQDIYRVSLNTIGMNNSTFNFYVKNFDVEYVFGSRNTGNSGSNYSVTPFKKNPIEDTYTQVANNLYKALICPGVEPLINNDYYGDNAIKKPKANLNGEIIINIDQWENLGNYDYDDICDEWEDITPPETEPANPDVPDEPNEEPLVFYDTVPCKFYNFQIRNLIYDGHLPVPKFHTTTATPVPLAIRTPGDIYGFAYTLLTLNAVNDDLEANGGLSTYTNLLNRLKEGTYTVYYNVDDNAILYDAATQMLSSTSFMTRGYGYKKSSNTNGQLYRDDTGITVHPAASTMSVFHFIGISPKSTVDSILSSEGIFHGKITEENLFSTKINWTHTYNYDMRYITDNEYLSDDIKYWLISGLQGDVSGLVDMEGIENKPITGTSNENESIEEKESKGFMNDLLDGFGDFGTSIADAMNDVAGIGQNVSSFFKNVFNWMPTPILSMILLSITLTVGLSVLRFLRG